MADDEKAIENKPTLSGGVDEFSWRSLSWDYWLLAQGRTTSVIGTQLSQAGLMLWFSFHLDSAFLASGARIAPLLVSLIMFPLGGVIADNFSRRKLVIWADVGSGAAALGMAAFCLAVEKFGPLLWLLLMVIACEMVLSVFNALFMPASEALLTNTVTKPQLLRARSIFTSLTETGRVTGTALSGLLFKLLGPVILFALDGLSFFISALFEARIRKDPPRPKTSFTALGFLGQMAEGFKYLWRDSRLKRLALMAICLNVWFGPFFLLFPFFLKDDMHLSEDWYGWLMGLFTTGMIIGSYLTPKALTYIKPIRLISILVALCSLCLGGLVYFRSAETALPLMWALGFFISPGNVIITTGLQAKIPDEFMARVMSCVMVVAFIMQPIVLLLSSWAYESGTVPGVLQLKIMMGGLLAAAIIFATSRGLAEALNSST